MKDISRLCRNLENADLRAREEENESWIMECSSYAGRRTKFAPVKSLRFSELFLGILRSEFRFIVFFPLGCGVDSWIPPLQFFQSAKGKAPKEAWGGHLSCGGINVIFLRPHESQLSAMRCVTLNQIDPSYMICVPSFVVLCPHYPTLSCLFLSTTTRFLEKGKFSNRLRGVVLSESCLRCSKILRIDWFWKSGWLIQKSALCTRIALLPHWGPESRKCLQRLNELMISMKNRVAKSVCSQEIWGAVRS